MQFCSIFLYKSSPMCPYESTHTSISPKIIIERYFNFWQFLGLEVAQCTAVKCLISRTRKTMFSDFIGNELLSDKFLHIIYRDLSYGEILAGRPGAWLVKKIWFICMQSQIFKKYLILKFKTISRTCFIFMIALTVYE